MSIRGVRTMDDFVGWLNAWEDKLLLGQPFPRPPIPGTGALRPPTDTGAVFGEGRAMDNCADSLLEDVLEGAAFLYHWAGPEPTAAMLARNVGAAWRLEEVLGAANKAVGRGTRRTIEAVVAGLLGGARLST